MVEPTPIRRMVEGDEAAIAAIRNETRAAAGATDIGDDAPVYFFVGGIIVRGSTKGYEVPLPILGKYLRKEGPGLPVARLPAGEAPAAASAPEAAPEASAAPAELPPELASAPLLPPDEELGVENVGGMPLEGDQEAIDYIRNVARLYHELPGVIFPVNGEVRWFEKGLFVVGEDKRLFQVPMDRVSDLIFPREYPQLPMAIMTESARKSLR